MHTPLTQQCWSGLTMLSRHSVGTYQGHKFTCNLLGNARPQSSQFAEPLWTDSGLKKWNWCAQTDLHFKKKKSIGEEWIIKPSPQILASEEKANATKKASAVVYFKNMGKSLGPGWATHMHPSMITPVPSFHVVTCFAWCVLDWLDCVAVYPSSIQICSGILFRQTNSVVVKLCFRQSVLIFPMYAILVFSFFLRLNGTRFLKTFFVQ